jgi:hypothetical protein
MVSMIGCSTLTLTAKSSIGISFALRPYGSIRITTCIILLPISSVATMTDVGYHLIRVTDEQSWTPSDQYNLFKTMILALGFEWAVAFHDIQISVDEYADTPQLVEIMQPKARD